MKSRSWMIVAAGCAVFSATRVEAASFDCAKARAPDEKAICADRTLNDLDIKMAVMLKIDEGFVAMGQRGAIQDDQVAWLKARHDCRSSRVCLRQSYLGRIAALQTVIDTVASHGPF